MFLALTFSLATDLVRRFNFDGIDARGAVFVVLPTLLAALSAGSVLSKTLEARFKEICTILRIPRKRRSFAAAVFTGLLLLTVLVTWLLLPQISRGYNNRGVKALDEGRLVDAEDFLQRAGRLDPTNALAFYNLGATYEDLQRMDHAKSYYQIAFAAGEIRASNNLGRLLILEDKPDHAAQVLLRARDVAQVSNEDIGIDTHYNILKNLGWARLKQERFSEARDYLGEAIALSPARAAAHCLLGKLFSKKRQVEAALSEWEGCLAADRYSIEEDLWLGEAKAFLARHDLGGK